MQALHHVDPRISLATPARERVDRYSHARDARLGNRNRAGVFKAVVVAVVFAAAAAAATVSSAAGAATASEAPAACHLADGSYEPACRMLPGHADGWFQPNQADSKAPSLSVRVPWAGVR